MAVKELANLEVGNAKQPDELPADSEHIIGTISIQTIEGITV